MGIGVSIFFITLGAILKFAIRNDVLGEAVNIGTIGIIFMIVGGVGLILSIGFARQRGSTADNSLYRDNEPPQV